MIGGISVSGVIERNFGLIAFCIQLAQALNCMDPLECNGKKTIKGFHIC